MVIWQYDIYRRYIPKWAIPGRAVDKHATGDRVWRLLKSLYGTKQAAHNWNRVIDSILKGLGFEQSKDDSGLYLRALDSSIITIHVDDLLCTGTFRSHIIWEEYTATPHSGSKRKTKQIPGNGCKLERQ